MAFKLITADVATVTSAGTAVQVNNSHIASRTIIIQADQDNESVTSSNGISLGPGENLQLTADVTCSLTRTEFD